MVLPPTRAHARDRNRNPEAFEHEYESSKPPCDVIFGLFLVRIGENFRRRTNLDEPTHVKERCEIGDASRLLHVVRNDDNRVLRFQSVDQFLDFRRSNWIERRAGFVHQKNFRFHGQRACDAEPLLLAT